MYDYRGKLAGIGISAVGFMLVLAEKLHPFSLKPGWTPEQHYGFFVWVALLGLFLMVFSKEKAEDERAKLVRLKAFQISFMVTISTLMAFSLMTSVTGEPIGMDASFMNIVPATALILYLLVFHVGLHFDQVWEYEDRGLFDNWRHIGRNKWGILAYLVICAILMIILVLL